MKSVYIHIPFCKDICTYCDFCKLFYNDKWVSNYLDVLEKEINFNYNGEMIDTIYIGGGTPSCLSLSELEYLFKMLSVFKVSDILEFTIECNVDITLEKVNLFKKYGVNRISIGVQSFLDKNLSFLGRKHNKDEVFKVVNLFKENGFNNINIDLIYALPNQNLGDLNEDLNYFLELDVSHISTYSLLVEPNTKLYINNIRNISEDIDCKMYDLICSKLCDYEHYEVSNFAKKGFYSKHNMCYWDNNEYYGFGLGAAGYINGVRYYNTRSLNDYLNGNYVLISEKLNRNELIENAFILGFRKVSGINIDEFQEKYNLNLEEVKVVKKLLEEGKLVKIDRNISIRKDLLYVSNDVLVDFMGEDYE